jgi:hypothetical protein
MSTGGIFKLIVNNGVQDNLLMATDYLNHRLKVLAQRNRNNSVANSNKGIDISASWIPDINSISKSHMIFIDGSYKPFVASGFEYNKVTSSGNVEFDSKVSFTIPVFGDFVNDCVIHIKLSELSVKDNRDKVRYISLLGHRILKNIELKINSSVLDSTTSDDYNSYYQFHVPTDKKVGWLRNMGQEVPEVAELTGDPEYDTFKEYRYIGDGNQTFKQKHEPIELWIPLLFWFKNIKNALPNFAIPYGQTNINIDIAPLSDLVGFADYQGSNGAYNDVTITTMEMYMNNIFLQPEIVKIFCSKFGFSLIRVHTRHKEIINKPNDNILLSQLKWPTETMYLSFKPMINLTNSQQWHKSSQLVKKSIKMPVIAKNNNLINIVGVYPGYNSTENTVQLTTVSGITSFNTTLNFYRDYELIIISGTGYVSNDIEKNKFTIKSNSVPVGPNNMEVTINDAWNITKPDVTTKFEFFKRELAINDAIYYKELPTISDMEIIAYGITIFQRTPESFFNSYLPYRFGTHINTPRDRGMYMVNYSFLPGDHQPSGHINISRAREFYLNYNSTFISPVNKCELLVLCDAINFLLVSNGSAILRFST